MIAIVNYGIGNLDSVCRAFQRHGAETVIAERPEEIEPADHIVLPGVGFFSKAMRYLDESGLLPVLNVKVLEAKTPILGICLGFQMFMCRSEEGGVEGLGWIDGEAKRFRFDGLDPTPKMPHMGWNDLSAQKESPLLAGIHPGACFYFAHSYAVRCRDADAVLTTSQYGHGFVSAVHKGNIFGTQFHPEKSHANGLKLIENFLGYTGNE